MTDAPVFHGGNLGWAEAKFGRPVRPWIDLSTGVNPWPYPIGSIRSDAWSRLPDARAESEMREAAARYYCAPEVDCVVSAPGSQILIQLLPFLRPPSRVAVLSPTYGEHAPCWEAGGHHVTRIDDADLDGAWDVVVVTNPNNPDGVVRSPMLLNEVAERLAARGGWLVIDEAFADTSPQLSLAPQTNRQGRIVLRSFGKFFGLPGLRLGFVLAPAEINRRIAAALGPWAVSGPALEIAKRAFCDNAWIEQSRVCLTTSASRLDDVLRAGGLEPTGSSPLFRLVEHSSAASVFQSLGDNGILVRNFPDQPNRLRLGLPPDDAALTKLRQVLAASNVAVS